MNRISLCLLFVIAFVFGQGIAPHAHLEHTSDDHIADHHTVSEHRSGFHIHTHVISEHIDASHEFSDVTQIDLLQSAFSSHKLQLLSMPPMLAGLFVIILAVLWFCIERSPPAVPLVHFGPPQLRSSSPRAPPR